MASSISSPPPLRNNDDPSDNDSDSNTGKHSDYTRPDTLGMESFPIRGTAGIGKAKEEYIIGCPAPWSVNMLDISRACVMALDGTDRLLPLGEILAICLVFANLSEEHGIPYA